MLNGFFRLQKKKNKQEKNKEKMRWVMPNARPKYKKV
jgi:hypothetical protein